jgi:ATP-dependent helicase HrpA
VVAEGKNLDALRREVVGQVRVAVADAADDLERRGCRVWPVPELPRTVERVHEGHPVQGYPALVDEGQTVGVRVLLTPAEQRGAMWQGTRRLLLLQAPSPLRAVADALPDDAKLTLTRNPHGSVTALLDDCTTCAVDGLLTELGGPAWEQAGFDRLRAAVEERLVPATLAVVRTVTEVLTAAREVERTLEAAVSPLASAARAEVQAQLASLVFPGFVTATGRDRLPDLARYLQAMARRVEKAAQDPGRDRMLADRLAVVTDEYRALHHRLGAPARDPQLTEIRWLIEELRVSLFAQQLGTRQRISEARIFRVMADLEVARSGTAVH